MAPGFRFGDGPRALSELKLRLSSSPHDPAVWLELARAYFELDRYELACHTAAIAQRLAKESPLANQAALLRAEGLILRRKHKEALAMAVSRKGCDCWTLIECEALLALGFADQALERLDVDSARADELAALCHLHSGRWEVALALLGSLEPLTARGTIAYSTALALNDSIDEAVELACPLADDPTASAENLVHAARLSAVCGMYSESARLYEAAWPHSDDERIPVEWSTTCALIGAGCIEELSPEAFLSLGRALRQGGNLLMAIVAYKEAVGLFPEHAAAHLELGDLLRRAGREEEAIFEYQRTILCKPREPAIWVALATTLHAMGLEDRAIEAVDGALKLDPLDDAALALRAAIRIRPAA